MGGKNSATLLAALASLAYLISVKVRKRPGDWVVGDTRPSSAPTCGQMGGQYVPFQRFFTGLHASVPKERTSGSGEGPPSSPRHIMALRL